MCLPRSSWSLLGFTSWDFNRRRPCTSCKESGLPSYCEWPKSLRWLACRTRAHEVEPSPSPTGRQALLSVTPGAVLVLVRVQILEPEWHPFPIGSPPTSCWHEAATPLQAALLGPCHIGGMPSRNVPYSTHSDTELNSIPCAQDSKVILDQYLIALRARAYG